MKILTSRKGFTLIELLVVIGILAVLAAIAIPSVAGLIDRANVSSDNTNANEMSNSMERFVSEYELYKQDIASGAIKDTNGDGIPDNLNASQSRVYNVTKAVTRSDIEALEGEFGLNGIRIDIDSKYAQNFETAKAIMQNYMKTSSSTFEPKQSDMAYWYHKLTGYTVVAPTNIGSQYLYDRLPSDIRYGIVEDASLTDWICISLDEDVFYPDVSVVNVGADEQYNNQLYFDVKYNGDRNIPQGAKIYIIVASMNFLENEDTNLIIENLNGVGIWDITSSFTNPIKKMYTLHITGMTSDALKERQLCMRLCYEYIEDGQVKHQYSPAVIASFDEMFNK